MEALAKCEVEGLARKEASESSSRSSTLIPACRYGDVRSRVSQRLRRL